MSGKMAKAVQEQIIRRLLITAAIISLAVCHMWPWVWLLLAVETSYDLGNISVHLLAANLRATQHAKTGL